ncbi:MAG TPA: hypothetical protein VGI16_13970 [Candidatus Acidoferrum sp.]|jgi:hypothetical protein
MSAESLIFLIFVGIIFMFSTTAFRGKRASGSAPLDNGSDADLSLSNNLGTSDHFHDATFHQDSCADSGFDIGHCGHDGGGDFGGGGGQH